MNGQEVSAPPAGIEAAATVRFGSTSETIDYEYGFSPLHLAAECGHENVVRILLNSIGVKPECHTAIHVRTAFKKSLSFRYFFQVLFNNGETMIKVWNSLKEYKVCIKGSNRTFKKT